MLRKSLGFAVLMSLTILAVCSPTFGQDEVEIYKYPDVATVVVGEGPKRIAIIARDETESPRYEWKNPKNIGKFHAKDDDYNKPAIYYIPPSPDTFKKSEEKIDISLEVFAKDGSLVKTGTISFTLKSPTPFKIGSVRLLNKRNRPLVSIYPDVSSGAELQISVNTTEFSNEDVEINCTAEFGKIDGSLKYIAPKEKGMDTVTCKAKNKKTNETDQYTFLVNIKR